ncbi:spermine synthase [candidate division KSB1 bacterium]|nr:spermine synthase [Candidatus Aminicenantes bacterium]RQW03605.1 MAG: spermine synthase [candidate division KSB1 bacterium]
MEKSKHFPLAFVVLSGIQAKKLLQAKAGGLKKITASLDLGLSQSEIRLELNGIATDEQPLLDWRQLQAIADWENKCFRVLNGSCEEIRTYSESSQRSFSLFPTAEAPGLMISGFAMHRFKDISPWWAAWAMIRAAEPIQGRVLDTATGLGYTAIGAAQKAAAVISIERYPGSLEMARSNPWSQELFNHPGIRLIAGDSNEEIVKFADEYFNIIIHDPPSMSLAGDLYGAAFYRQAWRVLAANGRMFHYLGDPKSESGRRVSKGVGVRLQAAGFRRIIPKPFAHGVLACK